MTGKRFNLKDRIRAGASALRIPGLSSARASSAQDRRAPPRAVGDGKARPEHAATQPKQRPPAPTSLTAFWLKAVLGIALVLLPFFAAGLFVWTQNEDLHRLHRLDGYSAMTVRGIERRVASLQERLRELGTDPRLRDLFLAQSLGALRFAEESMVERIPDATRVRLLALDTGGVVELQTDQLSYAGLDLIQQARRRRSFTLLEAHRPGTAEEHLAIAAPVFDAENETVLGVVHVSLPTSVLPSAVGTDGEAGRIAYQQVVGDSAVYLGPGGESTHPRGPPNILIRIQGTSLRIAGWVNRTKGLDTELLPPAAAAYFLLMALVLGATWLPLRGAKRALALDFRWVVALVEDAVNRKPVREPRYRLAETRPMIKVITGLLRRSLPQRRPEPPSVAAEPQSIRAQTTASIAPVPDVGSSNDRREQPVPMTKPEASPRSTQVPRVASVPSHIFRANDIRGVVGDELSTELVYAIGLAVGMEAEESGNQTVIVGRDTRPTSEMLVEPLVAGLRRSGRDVLDLGVVPTPLVYFAARFQGETSGVAITASHNPETYNGLKIAIGGVTVAGERLQALRERILAGSFSQGNGSYRTGDLVSDYISHVAKDVAIARTLKIVVDCGNATAAVVAPQLYRTLGCDLVELDCDQDADLPGTRIPDPACPESLETLQQAVLSQAADVGLAFDIDGDRLAVVDSSGKVIWPDRVLMLLAADVLSRHPGTDVIFDVKSSHHLITEIHRNGGRPIMCKSGHASLKSKLRESGALLAGDRSGHIVFRERWFGFDDALYSGARLLEILALDPRPSAEVFAELPEAVGTPELILPLAENEAEAIMEAVLARTGELRGVKLRTEDGLRVESSQSWGLVRASSTQPALVFRFEADDESGLPEIKALFRRIMEAAAPELRLPF